MKQITISSTDIMCFEQLNENAFLFEAETIRVYDQYHTMSELYTHRHALFYALTKIYDNYITPLNTRVKCYKSKLHHDGTMFEDSFIVIMMINRFDGTKDQISYHLPLEWWDRFKLMEIKRAPEYDGYSSDGVLERLLAL